MGVIAVFSLVAVAGFSLVMMNAGNGSITVTADVETSKQCVANPNVITEEFTLDLTDSSVALVNSDETPSEVVKIVISGVDNPKLTGYDTVFTKGTSGDYFAIVSIGVSEQGNRIEIPIEYTLSGADPCMQVSVSTDGVAYYPEIASIKLQ